MASFRDKKYPLNSNISTTLHAGRCYSFLLADCDHYQATASIEIFYGSKTYILNKEESITCMFDGYVSTGNAYTRIRKKREIHISPYLYTFLLS